MHLLGEAALVEHYHDGQKDVLIDEPYFSYDNPKTYELVLNCTDLHRRSPTITLTSKQSGFTSNDVVLFCFS